MKSARSLALALAVFVALLLAAYFTFTAFRPSSSHEPHQSQQQPSSPATYPDDRPTGRANASQSPAGATEPPAPAPAGQSIVGTLETKPAGFNESGLVVEVIRPVETISTPAPVGEFGAGVSSSPPEGAGTSEGPAASVSTSWPAATSTSQVMDASSAPASSEPAPPPATTTTTSASTTASLRPVEMEMETTMERRPPGQSAPDTAPAPAPAPANVNPIGEFQLSGPEQEQWQEFKRQHAKVYPSAQEERRRAEIFAGNLRFINSYNRQPQASSFQLGVNKFADLQRDEINAFFIGPTVEWANTLGHLPSSLAPLHILADQETQTGAGDTLRPIDWRSNLTNLAPPDQGTCRESSLFAVVASIEATLNAAGNAKVKLSESQLIDCLAYSGPPPVCSGHLSMVNVLDFLQRHAIRLASQQEYDQFRDAQARGLAPAQTCVPPAAGGQADARPKLGSYVQLHRDHIDEALLNKGPLVVALDASQPTFHFYKSGLYQELQCSSDTYNLHALLVGYAPAGQDGDPGQAHYTLRASLGPHWGELGYMRLLRDATRNKCLPQHVATYPNLAFE